MLEELLKLLSILELSRKHNTHICTRTLKYYVILRYIFYITLSTK